MLPRVLLALAMLVFSGAVACRNASDMTERERPADARPTTAVPAAGVPLALAQDRAARLADVRYQLHFVIPSDPAAPVTGTARLRFRLNDASRPLALDFAGPAAGVHSAHVQGRPADLTAASEHVVVPARLLREGENEIALSFQSSDLPLNRQPEFMYTLFVPARARLAFPCFDQPDLKARYSLTLDVPAGWEALGNGAATAHEAIAGGRRILFAETMPVSTYLFAFAAGRFSLEAATRAGRELRMLHRETDAQKVARNREAVFDLHEAALAWMEQYTGIPYPFGKFDFLLVPSFQFGGMEHPGAIFYNAPALLLDPSATQNQLLGRASLIAHETAHMWFGDLVTMRWFDDVWMKEVFANFMAAKIVNPSFPGINHELRFLYAHYPQAYEVDRTAGTNPIRQELQNLDEAGSLYGAIIYQKAPIVMRQLEMIVSPDGLRDGLREYLRRHAYGNAAWPDLIAILDAGTPQDLAAWSRAWVEEAGRPAVTTTARVGHGALHVTLVQEDGRPDRRLVWPQRLDLAVGLADEILHVPVLLDGREASVTVSDPRAEQARFVLPSGRGLGYGDFVLDRESRAYLAARLHEVGDPLTRGAAAVTLWEGMLGGRVPPARLFDTLIHAVAREADELNVQRMLTYSQQIYWKFLPADERASRTPGMERVLKDGLGRAGTSSLKAAWFGALRHTAGTPKTLAWLERVWSGAERVPGLTLAEPDYISLALELAVREVPGADRILREQRDRTKDPDRRAEFEFVMPALSADEAERDAFFERLRDVAARRREPWVLRGLGYLHHPLRAAHAERYISPSLELLQEIQRTGDIFFPKRWMDATLGGHQSPAAARTVRAFLDRLPEGYPDRLRRVILSSADDLFRARRLPNQHLEP
jgi:aminopeptidase N